MTNIRPILFLIILSFFSQIGNSQTSKNDSILKISDSILISMTSLEYFSALERDTIPDRQEWTKVSDMTDLTKVNSESYKRENTFITYGIYYKLKKPKNNYDLYVINEIGTMGPAGVFIELNDKYELVNPRSFTTESNVKYEFKAYQRYLSSTFITKEKAKLVAEDYFSKGMKDKNWAVQLMYDVRIDLFYWHVKKEKGFKKVIEETVYVNAENSEYIDKKTHKYSQNFWLALFY